MTRRALGHGVTGNYHLSLLVNGFLGFAAAMVQSVRIRPCTPVAPPPTTPMDAPALWAD